ncbi:MAG: hypothetical protein QRY16_20100 [Enterobacterales bacterium endosymbiont of Blomia tropicalis]|uniref:hypothetical protein n=1 Tax=Mixta mediterraneensis TaxID=2758443 RepID=UPI0025A82BBB|nr:hypothetical protein [Mixta mediterraneensis]MDL4915980.1 hypothetical protein [Mixta mediterraneensis]
MVASKFKIIIPVLIVLALIIWWLTPHYSAEDKAYYVSVFCAIHHDDEQKFLTDMSTVIEGSNSDYALQKIHFEPALGKQVIKAWQKLSPQEQASAAHDNTACQHLLND